MLRKILLGAATALILAVPLLAQESGPASTRLAYAFSDALYVLEPGGDTPLQVDVTPTYNYFAAWSPDTTKLAYLVSADGQPFSDMKTLKVWDGAASVDVVTNAKFATDVPVNWTRDGKLVYMIDTGTFSEEGSIVEAYTIDPVAGAVPQLVSNQLPVVPGCGGGSTIPMDWATWVESGFGSKPFLQLTDYGLIYPSICAGGRGALFRTFSNELTPFSDGLLSDMTLSADQRSVAGLVMDDTGNTSLVTINLDTMEETIVATTTAPQQVAWGSDGSLYYASSTEAGNLLDGLTEEQLRTFSATIGIPDDGPVETKMARNTLSIYKIAPDGTETLLFDSFDAYTIGRMQVVGSTLYFSAISNGAEWIQAVVDGAITPETHFDMAGNYIHTNLYKLDLTNPDSDPVLVMPDAQQFAAAGQ